MTNEDAIPLSAIIVDDIDAMPSVNNLRPGDGTDPLVSDKDTLEVSSRDNTLCIKMSRHVNCRYGH